MVIQIKQWGNSQGIRIPKDFMQDIHLKVNDYVDIREVPNGFLITKTFRHKTLEERTEEFGGTFGQLEEYDWGEPRGREFW